MRNLKTLLSFALLLLIFSSCAHKQNLPALDACHENRATFDIGSGTSRFLVATFDICRHRLEKTLFEESRSVSYRASLDEQKNLSPEIMKKGKEFITLMKAKALSLGALKYSAVGTEVFRIAANGRAYVDELEKELHFKMLIIDQSLEARLAYKSAKHLIGDTNEDFAVWDIGSGSTQIVTLLKDKFEYLLMPYGAGVFKDLVIKEVQKKDNKLVKSPNPLRKAEALNAQKLFTSLLKKSEYPEWFLKKKNFEKIYGLGGVLYHSVRGQIHNDKEFFTKAEVESTLKKRLGLKDSDIGGDYADTEVSNLVMVLSFMKFFKFEKIYPLKANLSQGLMYQDNFELF